jgi:hypothetical protein
LPLEIAFEFAHTLRQYGLKGIEYSEAPLDTCSRMSNPRRFLPGSSLVATSGVAGRLSKLPTVTFSVCVNLASQSIPTWNRIISWLKEMESLRKLPPELSDLLLVARS